jgi:hypothetical protein
MKHSEDDNFFFHFTFLNTGHEKAFVTHYRLKHLPLSEELKSVFDYLGLKAFHQCPEFDFEECFFRTVRFERRDNDIFDRRTDEAHRCFDAPAKFFSKGIEKLLEANSLMEGSNMSIFPIRAPSARFKNVLSSHTETSRKADKRPPTNMLPGFPDSFDVAVSFVGTQRGIAENLAKAIRDAGFSVFYDDFYAAQLWGRPEAACLQWIIKGPKRTLI